METSPIKVRKLGHAVLVVNDIERTTKFWTEIMGFKVSDTNEQGMVFLRFGGDHHTIGLAAAKEKGDLPGRTRTGLDHLAFEVGSMDELFRTRDFLREKGVEVTFEGRKGPGSNPGLEFLDPDGFKVEVYAGMDQVGWEGKSRPASQWHRVSTLEDVVANPLP
jgi:catechol 2,3-dioxygenase-like lactoylglutathione lyase family enzyme